MKRMAFVLLLLAGCGIQEHPDFLIGRQCVPEKAMPCDPGQVCLPHMLNANRFDDFRCRDKASFDRIAGGGDPPLAYCDEVENLCPEGLVCRPDRIRVDGGPRPNVCKSPDDVFIPPNFDGGVSGGN